MNNKELLYKKLNALRLEVDSSIVDDIKSTVDDIFKNQHDGKPLVSGSLPMYDVDELNEIITLFNNKEIDLYTCIGRVWNKAYFIGANEEMKAGRLGNDR